MENSKTSESKGIKIFLVDDDPQILGIYKKILMSAGYFTIAVSSAQDALEIIGRGLTKVDLVVTDINMPGINGIELYQKVKEYRPELTDKIIFVTGGVFPDEMAELLDRIPNPKLIKPLAAGELLKTVALIASGK